MIGNITQARDSRAELGKPNSWNLFKAIKCTSKVTNLVWFNRETRRRLHINFFTKIPIKEYIFDIHLKKGPIYWQQQ